jgi:nicotinate (nicotinamide) nucleotide adenylyltransferase
MLTPASLRSRSAKENRKTRLGVLPGTFNPPTLAHLALGHAALQHCDRVLFVLPRSLPHKDYGGVGFEDRLRLLERAVAEHPQFAAASSQGGLFLEIAQECREAYGRDVEIAFLCGRDAAERIVEWKYERPEMLAEMFEHFSLLVARRQGEYVAPEHLQSRIRCLDVDLAFDAVSATEVRERIASGTEWRQLVPEAIAQEVERLYR